MKNFMLYLIMFVIYFMGVKACDHEAEQNEIKNRQWVQDAKDGKPFTNYGE